MSQLQKSKAFILGECSGGRKQTASDKAAGTCIALGNRRGRGGGYVSAAGANILAATGRVGALRQREHGSAYRAYRLPEVERRVI